MSKAGGFNGTLQVIDVPGSGSAFLSILATGPLRYLKAIESVLNAEGAANVPQGIVCLVPNDNTVGGFTQQIPDPANFVFELGDPMALHGPRGSIIGNGPGMIIGIGATSATILFKVRSLTATPTAITLAQYY